MKLVACREMVVYDHGEWHGVGKDAAQLSEMDNANAKNNSPRRR
jgi:hypothetical protein